MFTPTATLEDAIIKACTEHEDQHGGKRGYRRCLVFEGFFVKFDDYISLQPQAETQIYVFQCAMHDTNAPRIPEVLHFLHRDGDDMAYIIMDYINLTATPPPDFHSKVAHALQWLHDLPLPHERVRIGPLGSGCARHPVFKDYVAPLPFTSVQAIQRYLNHDLGQAIARFKLGDSVDMSQDALVFTQSDMHESNFGVDDNGKAVLFDFGDVGILPESFARYTMASTAPFTAAVAKHLGWPSPPDLNTLSKLRGTLWMVGKPELGLDENGMPTSVN
ncbi:hypothetical protein FRC17_007154 [Serendipita sp. 399]|nr:hypothetical protein FRC17_007154 [Serendipita sp. 399]